MNLFEVYKLWDIEPVKGLGTTLWDKNGTEYTDLYGGHAVISVGHCHPHYVSALTEQLGKLGFYSNAVQNSLQKTLAGKLGKASGYDDYSLFLCNSGAEANENAMKLASFHTDRAKVLAFGKAFHGRTSGAVAATDNPKIQSPFNATDHVEFVPLNDIEAAEKALNTRKFAAVIIEGIQGVAGIYEPSDDFLQELRQVLKEKKLVVFRQDSSVQNSFPVKTCLAQKVRNLFSGKMYPADLCFAGSGVFVILWLAGSINDERAGRSRKGTAAFLKDGGSPENV